MSIAALVLVSLAHVSLGAPPVCRACNDTMLTAEHRYFPNQHVDGDAEAKLRWSEVGLRPPSDGQSGDDSRQGLAGVDGSASTTNAIGDAARATMRRLSSYPIAFAAFASVPAGATLTADETYAYDGANGLSGITDPINGPVTTATDAAGRVTQHGDASFTWDAADRMLIATNVAGTSSYAYDSQGWRTRKVTPEEEVTYTWGKDGVELEQVAGGATRDYVHGAGMVLGVGDEVFGHDALGSPVFRVVGLSTTTTRFDAWGRIRTAPPTDPPMTAAENQTGFTGHNNDVESGLVYAQARYLDPSTGRFLSEDPFPGDIYSPLTTQGFTYANANPTRYVDPDGRSAVTYGAGAAWGFSKNLPDVANSALNPIGGVNAAGQELGAALQAYVTAEAGSDEETAAIGRLNRLNPAFQAVEGSARLLEARRTYRETVAKGGTDALTFEQGKEAGEAAFEAVAGVVGTAGAGYGGAKVLGGKLTGGPKAPPLEKGGGGGGGVGDGGGGGGGQPKQLGPGQPERIARRQAEKQAALAEQKGPFETSGGSEARSLLHRALERQGLQKAPAKFKERWSESGYDYEVRAHPAAPAFGKNGTVYRVGRRRQGVQEGTEGQGYGWEYADDKGNWHHTSTLKPSSGGAYNAEAAAATHILLNQ